MDLARLLLLLSGDAAGAMRAVGEVDAGLETMGGAAEKTRGKFALLQTAIPIMLGIGAVMAGIGAVSLKMAADFDQQMTMIQTQAHAAGYNIDELKQKVLALAPQVGWSPEELALSLYHVASAGIPATQAIESVTAAAQLAKIGQANLEDSTQAVIGVMSAMGGQFKTAGEAAAMLNAIVGTGDMKLQQLDKAIATGILPTAVTYGLTLRDVGAALATITDNVTPADEAATRLRMTFTMLGAPTHEARKALGALGIDATQLGDDMRKPNGLLVALGDLRSHLQHIDVSKFSGGIDQAKSDLMHFGFSTDQVNQMVGKLGPNATEQADLIARAFGGGRSSAAIMTLLTEFDKFEGKYKVLDEGTKNFASDWDKTQHLFNVQVDRFKAGADAMFISVGEKLMPVAAQWLGKLADHVPAMQKWADSFTDKMVPALDKLLPKLADLAKKTAPVLADLLNMTPRALEIAGALSDHLAPALDFVHKNFDTVKSVVEALIGLKAVAWFKGLADAARAAFATTAGEAALDAGKVVAAWTLAGARAAAGMTVLAARSALIDAQIIAGAAIAATRYSALWLAATGQVIAGYVALGVSASINAARAAGAWALSSAQTTVTAAAAAARFTALWLAATAQAIAGYVALGVSASISAAQATASWALAAAGLVLLRLQIMLTTAAQWAWDLAMDANPIGIVIVAVALLVAGLVLLIANWDSVVAWLGRAWSWIKNVASAIDRAVESNAVLSTILSILLGPLGAVIGGVTQLVKHWDEVTGAVGGAMSQLGSFASWIYGSVMGALNDLAAKASAVSSALQSINPFAQHSPSLVQNVTAGTKIIADQYGQMAESIRGHAASAREALTALTTASPTVGVGLSLSMAGGGTLAAGAIAASIDLAALTGPGGAGGPAQGGDVNVYVTNPAPKPYQIGRELASVLKTARR